MTELLKLIKTYDVHTVISIITMPNEKSVALHKGFGFKEAGYFKEVGYKMNKWLDVIYLQLMM